jgi:Arabinose efflux permease
MKYLKQKNHNLSAFLACLLIPISGFAMDVYIPSFPDMALSLGTTADNIQFTLTIFLLSYGISQLFVGALLDSYGRYNLHIASLAVFVLSCVCIYFSHDIYIIYLMRLIQGITIAVIVVAKRVLFIDIFTGDKQKKYVSMVTVIWSTAPIIAPFAGGYLQASFGWRSNFLFLGIYGLVMLLLELRYSGETIQKQQALKFKPVVSMYKELLRSPQFLIGIGILAFSYGMVMVFGMSMPFIVEDVFGRSSIVTGYSALASGVAIFLGGLLSRAWVDKPFLYKLTLANSLQLLATILMIFTVGAYMNLYTILIFVVIIHFWQGLTYNTYFTYTLTTFPKYAGTASGLASGGSFIIFSFLSFLVVHTLHITDQLTLGYSYAFFVVSAGFLLLTLRYYLKK